MINPVQVTFRNMPHSDSVEALIREKVANLDRYYNHIVGCRVMVELPHRHHLNGPHHHIRIDLTVPGGEIVIKREPTLRPRQRDEEIRTKCTEVETPHKHLKVAVREAFESARRRLQDYARRQRSAVKRHEETLRGRVCRLHPESGYGYIETKEGREIYFHQNSVLRDDFLHIEVGSEVALVEEEGDRGPQASTVRLLGIRRRHRKVTAKKE